MDEDRFSVEEIDGWLGFLDLYHKYWAFDTSSSTKWIFRGEISQDWPLKTTLEREAERTGLAFDELPKVEDQVISESQRKAHQYLSNIPHIGDHADWFSLMRHYGAPSRLLDWTYSPGIAAFFAVQGAEFDKDKDTVECAVWALDSSE